MSDGLDLDRAINAVRAAASAAGDASGNCDAAMHLIERGNVGCAAEEVEWAEQNAKSALHRIAEARAAIAKAAAPTAQQLIDSHRTGDHALSSAVKACGGAA